ncbi:hypothetical protein [Paracoccus yeei]|uniref:hypothetical protein n=1 Tax=Paracoccus yeei TaxID=147645 RepID=UPI0006856188|nr:hypothetical protein [Paracoccus yeei]OWJ91959.1 hypothetical protein CDV54_14155 [Paracoccus yeei]
MDEIVRRAANLTQRLDHMVPDPEMPLAFNRKAAADLAAISEKLYELLPDPSLSPLERIERLARVVEGRSPDLEQLQPAHKKLEKINERLTQLMPDDSNPMEKIDQLYQIIVSMAPVELRSGSTIQMLEAMGDPRGKIEPE